ncbi:MAG: hypothetical protein WB952_05650 [Terriglobales bacterium]
METKKSADVLLEKVKAIINLANTQGLIVFYGWAHGSDQKTVDWNEEHGGDCATFLECAKAVDAKLLYLNWAPFEEFQVDEALEHRESTTTAGNKLGVEQPDTIPSRRQIEAYRDKVGITAVIDLAFVHENIVHIYQCYADWFETFQELTEGLEVDSDENEDHFPERVVDKALVRKWASQLASHPKFGMARSGDQREFLLESIAGTEIDTLPVGDILARADSIYQFEIKPTEEERMRAKARELREQGLNINAIAVKLGISKDRVSGLLQG